MLTRPLWRSAVLAKKLIGHSHNVVRHPDMPPEAFDDLWQTLKAGSPWQGIVKNRAKDGGFYWVDAYVTPVTENGQTIGYMSVRNAPSPHKFPKPSACTPPFATNKPKCHPPCARTSAAVVFPAHVGRGLLCGALAGAANLVLDKMGLAWMSDAAGGMLGIAPMAWLLPQLTRTLNEVSAGFINLAEGRLNIPVRQSWHCALGDVQVRLESMRIYQKPWWPM